MFVLCPVRSLRTRRERSTNIDQRDADIVDDVGDVGGLKLGAWTRRMMDRVDGAGAGVPFRRVT